MTTDAVQDLCAFIDSAPCPAFAAATLVKRLQAAHFKQVKTTDPAWDLGPGAYVVQRGAAVIAFIVPQGTIRGYRLIGAHTDSPHLRLKPRCAYHHESYRQFGVEVYGGALVNSWLDRDLGLAGTVYTADGKQHLIRLHQPLARVPQLAIHLDRTVREDGLKLNPQQHLAPIWGLADDREPYEVLLHLLAAAANIDAKTIVSHDLSLYDLTPSALGGSDDGLLFAPRLDNLASCHAGLLALLQRKESDDGMVPVLVCFDHEEVGSTSDTGADGALLAIVLERIALERGLTRSAFLAALASSSMLSADMAHAVHPNYVDRHEPRHKPYLGEGPVLKSNANVRYATTAATAAQLRLLAERIDVPLQDFVTRTDLGCGSTIGPSTAARLGIAVADLGTPMLSMHSARECAASADHANYIRLLTGFLSGC